VPVVVEGGGGGLKIDPGDQLVPHLRLHLLQRVQVFYALRLVVVLRVAGACWVLRLFEGVVVLMVG
jgi:hypothetical protein